MPDTTFSTDSVDGEGTHEGCDYIDEAIKAVGAIIAGKGGRNVHQSPGSEEPGPGVLH